MLLFLLLASHCSIYFRRSLHSITSLEKCTPYVRKIIKERKSLSR